MIYLKKFNESSEFDYESTKKRIQELETELSELKNKVFEYENSEMIPELDRKDVKHFILDEPRDGTKFKYVGPTITEIEGDKKKWSDISWENGEMYYVSGVEDFIRDYGHESFFDGVYDDKNFNALLDGDRFSLVYKVKD